MSATAATFYDALESDLRALSSEARKTDSLATQITGWLQHTDFPQIKECAERALLNVRAAAQQQRGIEAIRTKEILRPFLLVCESKNPKLIGSVLGTIQKLLAHNAVSDEGRQQIIHALNQVERSSDDTVKLKILQTALTMLQNSGEAEDQEGAGQVLSLCMRIYSHNKSSPTVINTAAATVRQAVALLFDHAVPAGPAEGSNFSFVSSSTSSAERVATGPEIAAVFLLQDLVNMCAGSPPAWLKCPMFGRGFVLDLLEFVLLHRPVAFQTNSAFKALLQNKLAPTLADLCQAALDPEVEPASAGEAKLLLRCIGALLRKHACLLPNLTPAIIAILLAGCNANRMAWQRLLSLQVLRWLMADPYLFFALFTAYDYSINHDMNVICDTVNAAVQVIEAYMKAADASDDDGNSSLNAIYKSKVDGKEQQMDVEHMVPGQAAVHEVWIAYVALELLLSVIAAVETLADAVTNAGSSNTEQLLLSPLSQAGMERSISSVSSASSSHSGLGRTTSVTISTLIAPVLSGSKVNTLTPSQSAALLVTADTAALKQKKSNSGSGNGSRGPGSSLAGQLSSQQQAGLSALNQAVVMNMVNNLYKKLLNGLSYVLSRCYDGSRHEAVMLQLLRGYQSFIFSAGAVKEQTARDAFLAALCEVAVTPATPDQPVPVVPIAKQGGGLRVSMASGLTSPDDQHTPHLIVSSPVAAVAGGGAASGSGAAAAAAVGQSTLNALDFGVKNIHALRILFNCAGRLADVLEKSWILIVEVLCTLDRVLPPAGSGSKLDDGNSLVIELQILVTVANQLFESTALMSQQAVTNIMGALANVSRRSLAQLQGYQGPVPYGQGQPGASAGGIGATSTASGGTGGGAAGPLRLLALNRMVEVLLYNLPRIQKLWAIFLEHVLHLLKNGSSAVRAAAIEALDKSVTNAIGAPGLGSDHTQTMQQQQQEINVALGPRHNRTSSHDDRQQQQQRRSTSPEPGQAAKGAGSSSASGDVEYMLLSALDSIYRDDRDPDLRLGLLRIVLHVLQRHGETVTRGWESVLRLLEVVPAYGDATTIAAAFQCVEAISSDFLPSMPKQHLGQVLDIVCEYAAQQVVINISLSAIGLLWNATDLLGRTRAAAAQAAAAAQSSQPTTPSAASMMGGALSGLLSAFSLSRRPSVDGAVAAAAAVSASTASIQALASSPSLADDDKRVQQMGVIGDAVATTGSHTDLHPNGRMDMSEAKCTALLQKLFAHLKALSSDARPEVRNSGVRTLFLAVGSQATRFDPATWRDCLWEILFPLLQDVYDRSNTSSNQEAAAVELGKERGKAVVMLVHHSRNSEQKQWDETTILALNGLAKVLRANMSSVLVMPGFDDKWDEVCSIAANLLRSGRKAVAVAGAQLLTGVLQGYKPVAAAGAGGRAAYGYPWRRALAAIDEAVAVMALPNTPVPLQARSELLNGLSAVYACHASEGGFDQAAMQMLLGWLDALARHPTGTDDVTPVPGVLPQVQKLVLQIISQFNGAVIPQAWPDVLRTLAGFLCPFRAMQQRQQQEVSSQLLPASGTAAAAASNGSICSNISAAVAPAADHRSSVSGNAQAEANTVAAVSSDAVMLTNQYMGKIVGHLVSLYSHAPWQVRAALFGAVVEGLGECAALRHLAPEEPLWQAAAVGLVSVINAGLPAVNIMFVNHHQPPENAWRLLAAAFEAFLLGWSLPPILLPQQGAASRARAAQQLHHHYHQQQQQRQHTADTAPVRAGNSRHKSKRGSAVESPTETESRLQANVLDSLTDVVLASCSSAAHSLRARLVQIVAAGAASTADHACCHVLPRSPSPMETAAQNMASGSHIDSCNDAVMAQQQHQQQSADATDAGAINAGAISTQGRQPSSTSTTRSVGPTGTADGQKAPTVATSVSDNQPTSHAAATGAACPAAAKRFSQACLRKLALLASRGTEGSAGSMNAVMLEVAQIALPLLLERSAVVLQAYAAAQQKAEAATVPSSSGSSSQQPAIRTSATTAAGAQHAVQDDIVQPQQQQRWQQQHIQQLQRFQHTCLVEEATCVLQVLVNLQLDMSVLQVVLDRQPRVSACWYAAQQAEAYIQHQQQQQQQSEEQQRHSAAKPDTGQGLVFGINAHALDAGSTSRDPAAYASKQQGHLLLLYQSLAQCIGCQDRVVGALLKQSMLLVGKQLFG